MLSNMDDFIYDRKILIGRPRLTLKNQKCGNITCNKKDQFKKYKDDTYICECGYILQGEFEIEKTHKPKLFCQAKSCIMNKTKMDLSCVRCQHIGER